MTPLTGVALEDMSSGTTQLVPASSDDTASAVTNIGFDLWFDGVRATQFSCNANGICRLGATVVTTAFDNSTGFASTTNAPKIAPFFEDLCVGTNGKVHYKVTGTAPSRKLIVEWQNMQVTRGAGCAGAGSGTLQLWINESAAASNPGAIQFVYGNGIVASNAADGGASIGLQSGVATNFASVTASTDAVSYTVHDALNSTGVAAGKSYRFTPNVPDGPPTTLNYSMVTATSQQLDWTDNSSNELGFVLYRSLDNTNFVFIGQTAANVTTFSDTNLNPLTNYFYRVYGFTEGALSGVLPGSNMTGAPGNDTCNGAGGNWSSTGTWTDGTVPTAGDNVTIGSGCTVTLDVTNAAAIDVTINSGGTLQSPTTGTVVNNNLTVSGNFTNNGTLDFSTNGDTSGAILTFGAGGTNVSFSGTGATTDVRAIAIAKGSLATVVEMNLSNFTVRGVNTDTAGYLTLTSGTFKISGTNTIANRTFTTATYVIPVAGGLWLNNPNYTVAATASAGATSNNGLLRISQGVYNIGIGAGDQMRGGVGAVFTIEGGTVNVSGAFDPQSAVTYNQSGGTMNVGVVGNNVSNFGTFELFAAATTFNMSGGTINVINPSTGTTKVDYRNNAGLATTNITGGSVVIGATGAPASSIYNTSGTLPNTLINASQTLRVNNAAIFMRGSSVNNLGTIDFTGTSARFDFANVSGPMTYGGGGVFGTVATPFGGVGISANGLGNTTLGSPIVVNRVNFFSGGFVNANQITLGGGAATSTVVQVGNSTTPTAAGTFDVSPVYNTGTGGHIVLHLRTTTANRATGFEINPTRTLAQLTVDNDAVGGTLTLNGGSITVTAALTLTNGIVATGSDTLVHNGAVTRTNGYVNGNLKRDFTATGAYTYHVGNGGYSPVAATVTAGTGDLTVRAVGTAQPNIPTPSKALSRYWKLSGTGVTSDLAFTYLDPQDIPATANEAAFVIQKYDGAFTQPGGTVNTTTNTATITGVSSFSDWTLAEPGALVSPGALQLTSSTYSANEGAGTMSIGVNRVGGSDGAVTVDYALSGGTATGGAACGAGIDYVNTGGTVNFANGATSGSFNVTICGDSEIEPDETFTVTLSNPTGGAVLGTPTSATATILNDDASAEPVTVTATAGTTGPTGYATLTAAIAAVNDGTHQGNIVVGINQNTTESGPVVINSSGAGSASYTGLIIRPTVDGVTVAGPTTTGRGLIELNGADNVTIDGDNPNTGGTNRNLTLQNTAADTVTFTSVIRIALAATIVNTADNDTIKNLNILGNAVGRNIAAATTTTGTENTTFGILAGLGASTTSATTAPAAITSVATGAPAGATANNLLISNNSVATAARGVSINGAAATVFPGLQINGNQIGNPVTGDVNQVTAIGITAQGSANGVISGNTVWVEGFVASSSSGHGINVGVNSAVGTFTIEKNKVNRVRNNNPQSWSAYGINLGGSNSHIVQNNFVSGIMNDQTAGTGAFGTTFGAYGIRVAAGTGHKIYHNSVHLFGPLLGVTSTDLTAAFLVAATTQTGLDVRNNIFSNQVTGGNPAGTKNTTIFLPSGATSAMNLTLNNNIYFQGTDPLSTMAQVGATFATSVSYLAADFNPSTTTPAANFRSYSSTLSAAGTNDNASKAVDPQFVSNTDLHILPTSLAESAGADVGVLTDIDGDARTAVPDIGADEISVAGPGTVQFSTTSFAGSEGTIATINVIRSGGVDGTVGVTATVTDGTATGGATCSTGVDYINPGPQVLSFGPGVALQSFPITLCTDTSLESAETVTLTLSAPTGGTTIGANNPATLTIADVPPPLSGTINVGAGETFTSLTNPGGVFQALNSAGVSSNLVVNITSDLTAETGAVGLNQLTETGLGGYTVTFKPSGAARVISGTGPTSAGLINLNGTDRVIFDGSLSGGTDRSLTIANGQTGTSTVFWIKSASASNGATFNTVKNCIIHGTSVSDTAQTTAGILAGSGVTIGNAAEAPNNGNTITNNHIYSVQNSIYNQGNTGLDQNWTVTNNEFGSTVATDKNRFRGMLMGNANNFVISGNLVHGITNFAGTTGANTGIQIAFAVTNGMVTNNQISDVHNLSASGTGAFGMQLGASPTTNIVIANNFIWDVQAVGSATVASNGHGISITAATAGGYKIYHNSINMNTNQTSGTSAALNVAATVTAAGALDVRNNIFANTQTAGATRRAVHSLAAATVFAPIDYNDYFSTGSVGFIGGSDRPTLADWQAGTTQDANSKAADPLFVSPTNLHIQPASTMINMGQTGTGITTDIDGQARDATPDIGADEIVGGVTPGSLQFSSATYSVGEAGPVATITVTRTGGTDGTVTAQYATSNGTATGGASCGGAVDYVNTSGTVTFVNGDASETFDVPICNDVAVEGNETFNVTLSSPGGGAVIGTPSAAVVTITDDDVVGGTLTISDVRMFEGNSGARNFVFTVSYAGPSVPVSVQYATANGTAVAGVDYLAASGTLNFNAPGSQTVSVLVNSDTAKEANETFFVNLSSPTGATISDGQGVGIIIDEDRAYVADFDLDRVSDFSVFRASEGRWYVLRSASASLDIVDFGTAGDIAVPGDYDGDGITDFALWRPSTGQWFRTMSSNGSQTATSWGSTGDKPVQGDYDGDGKTDLAVYRPSTGTWWILRSSNGASSAIAFGINTDRPVQGDYDGDAKTDIAVYRDGTWYILRSSDGGVQIANFGLAADKPVSGDFDGDGKFDLAIYRGGVWWSLSSLTGTAVAVPWGNATDIPVPADYDGDGTTDRAVFRPSTGDWYVIRSSNSTSFAIHWGLNGDVPLPAAYLPQ
jgi:hypothetical protein